MQDPNDAYMHFNIDEVSGVITTRSQFDREEQGVYYIKVKAVDGTNSDAPGHYPPNTPNSGMWALSSYDARGIMILFNTLLIQKHAKQWYMGNIFSFLFRNNIFVLILSSILIYH